MRTLSSGAGYADSFLVECHQKKEIARGFDREK